MGIRAKIRTALFSVSGRSSEETMCQIRLRMLNRLEVRFVNNGLTVLGRAGDHPLAAGAAAQVSAFSLLPKLPTPFRQVMNDYIAWGA